MSCSFWSPYFDEVVVVCAVRLVSGNRCRWVFFRLFRFLERFFNFFRIYLRVHIQVFPWVDCLFATCTVPSPEFVVFDSAPGGASFLGVDCDAVYRHFLVRSLGCGEVFADNLSWIEG